MATDFEFEMVVEDSSLRRAESVALEAHDRVAEIERSITEFQETSPVWAVNRAGVGTWVAMPPNLADLLRLSQRLYEESGGYFSPFSKSEAGVSSSHFECDFKNGRMRRHHLGLRLGFGAIGKGFALDRAASLFRREGITDFRLSSGGSSWIFSGRDQNEEAWKISWAWRRDLDGDFAGRVLQLPEHEMLAVGVSGVLEQGNHFRFQGSALPVKIQSAFFAGKSAAEADALSTALIVGASIEGDEILTRLANRISSPAIAYVDLGEQIVYNHCFQTRFLSEQGTRK